MIAFLKLIRIQNLLIIAALQYLIRWLVIWPVLAEFGFDFQFGEFDFFCLVMSTVCISAAGYVINDYFDRQTDLLNRPDTVIVGKTINRRAAMVLHIFLNILGVLLGFYISWKIEMIELGFAYAVIAGLLWNYSTTYKRQFLIGNIIVALLTSLVPVMVVIYEVPLLNRTYFDVLEAGSNFNFIFYYTSVFAIFAFLTTLVREIIKDIEDVEGDNAYDRNTLPIVIGIHTTKIVVVSLIILTSFALFFIYFTFREFIAQAYIENHVFTFWYILFALVIPLLFLALKLAKAKEKKDYHFASNLAKIIMLLGILYLVYREIINLII